VYSGRDRTRLKLTLRAKRLGLSLSEAKEIIDMYDSPRDTGPQLQKFLDVLALHREQLEEQMTDLQANLDELKEHQREARTLLAKTTAKPAVKPDGAAHATTQKRKPSHAASSPV
jgi:DNA-binding transcriptional MerR regulator